MRTFWYLMIPVTGMDEQTGKERGRTRRMLAMDTQLCTKLTADMERLMKNENKVVNGVKFIDKK